jgi:polyisoprenoid-binding protein YceI
MMKTKTLVMAGVLAAVAAAGAGAVPFPDGKTCAAWKTKKTMFLFRKLEPVGMNCAARASIETLGGVKRVRVLVPIAKFDSGEPSRDKEVLKILKADAQPELEFLSRGYTAGEWDALAHTRAAAVEGTLKIGGKEFPVSAPFSFVGEGADAAAVGSFVTSFSAFEIKPPAVGGGLVAQVQDYLELHYRIPLAQVAGR